LGGGRGGGATSNGAVALGKMLVMPQFKRKNFWGKKRKMRDNYLTEKFGSKGGRGGERREGGAMSSLRQIKEIMQPEKQSQKVLCLVEEEERKEK